mmetsp:Transcript_24275/g.61500  ORF Transcript_24275/g.61500 Transcript_24275/m.61500 type:complete len:275 (+) Transcript_24275:871-1695(+)
MGRRAGASTVVGSSSIDCETSAAIRRETTSSSALSRRASPSAPPPPAPSASPVSSSSLDSANPASLSFDQLRTKGSARHPPLAKESAASPTDTAPPRSPAAAAPPAGSPGPAPLSALRPSSTYPTAEYSSSEPSTSDGDEEGANIELSQFPPSAGRMVPGGVPGFAASAPSEAWADQASPIALVTACNTTSGWTGGGIRRQIASTSRSVVGSWYESASTSASGRTRCCEPGYEPSCEPGCCEPASAICQLSSACRTCRCMALSAMPPPDRRPGS